MILSTRILSISRLGGNKNKGFAALAGQSFSMTISPEGRIADIRGVDEMLTRVLEKADLPEGPMKSSLEKSLKNQFGDQSLKEIMDTITIEISEKE